MVDGYTGHGIGQAMHESPSVPNVGWPGRGPRLRPGNVLAVEPMVAIGTPETEVLDDDWTVVTLDRTWSAHAEHTIAITDDGPEVLTVSYSLAALRSDELVGRPAPARSDPGG